MLNTLLAGAGQFVVEQVMAFGLVAALAAVGGFALGYLLKQRPDLKDEMQVVADHSEAIEAFATRVSVIAAEKFGIEANKFGYDKFKFAADVTQAALASVNIKGDPSRVNWNETYKAIRETAARLFPVHSKKPTAGGDLPL
jgi:hypothetical protein